MQISKNVSKNMRLLYLLTIFFIYRIVIALIEGRTTEGMAWTLFLLVYLVSITILYFVVKRWEKEGTPQVSSRN